MSYHFKFRGGVVKPTTQSNEKFLLFFLVGGEEIPLYGMLREGLVQREQDDTAFDLPDAYTTGANVAKIFTSAVDFGRPKQYHSFYFKFVEGNPLVTIKGFGKRSNYKFVGPISFLKRSEVLALLDDDNPSKTFVQRQQTLPIETLKQLITIDRSALKKGVRRIRIGARKRINNEGR